MPRSRALRIAPIAVLAAAVGASLVVAAPAAAAPGDDVLLFSNAEVVDPDPATGDGELAYLALQLADLDMVVHQFDGGDGTAAAWTAALADKEVVVFPEPEEGDLFAPGVDATDAWLSDAAAEALADWAQAGGTVVFSAPYQSGIVDDLFGILTGVDFTGAYNGTDDDPSAPRVIDDTSLPDPLLYANGTDALDISTWTDAQLDVLTPWYLGNDFLWAGELTAGSGTVAIVGYDYYPRPNDGDICAVDAGMTSDASLTYDWNLVLSALIDGGAPTVPPAPGTWSGTGFPVSITVEHGDVLGSGEWSEPPSVAQVTDRPVGAGAELDQDDVVSNPSEYEGCFAVDVDPAAQTITVTPVEDGYYGGLRVVVSSSAFSSVTLVSDALFDYEESDWALQWAYASSALTATWRSADLSLYAPDEEADGAETIEGGAAVFSYTLSNVLPATGTDSSSAALAALGLLAAGALATGAVRRRARA